VDLSVAVEAFNTTSIAKKIVTLVNTKFNKSEFITEEVYTIILQIIDGNHLGALLAICSAVYPLLKFLSDPGNRKSSCTLANSYLVQFVK